MESLTKKKKGRCGKEAASEQNQLSSTVCGIIKSQKSSLLGVPHCELVTNLAWRSNKHMGFLQGHTHSSWCQFHVTGPVSLKSQGSNIKRTRKIEKSETEKVSPLWNKIVKQQDSPFNRMTSSLFQNKNTMRNKWKCYLFLLLCRFILMLEKQSQFYKLLALHCHHHVKVSWQKLWLHRSEPP